MRLPRGPACLVALAACLAAGCGDDEDAPEPAGPPPDRTDVRFEGGEIEGTLYLVAGQDGLNADLYGVTGSLEDAERLTRDGRISSIDADDGIVAASNARASGSDRLEIPDLDTSGDALPGELIDRAGQAPDLSPGGEQLLYHVQRYSDDGASTGVKVLMTEPRAGARKRLAFSSKDPDALAGWGPQERVAVLLPGEAAIVLDPGSGRERRIDTGLERPVGFGTSAQGAVLAGERGKRFAIVAPGGAPRVLESSWDPLAWSPDGRTLLAGRGRRLGLMSPLDGSVEEIGTTSNGRVFQARWVRE